jgi:hypothetical protein
MFGVMGSKLGQAKNVSPCSRYVYILHYAKNYFYKVWYFPKIHNLTSLYSPTASGASVDPTSHFCSSAMLVLLIVGN